MILSSTFRKVCLSAASVASLGLIAPVSVNAQTGQGIAAVVNDDIITTYDLRQRVLFILATTGVERDEATLRRIQAQALRNLVDEELQMQEAGKFDQTIADEDVHRSMEQLVARNGLDPAEVETRLAAVGVSMSTMEDQVRSEIAWQRITGGLFGSRIRISDAQIDETHTRLSASASKPSYRVAEIYIESSPEIGGPKGALEGARAMIGQAKQGAPFQLLAQQFSSSATAAKGGDVGWVNEGELRAEIDDAIRSMEKGSISEPIIVPGGVYVVALIDKRLTETDQLYRLEQVRIDIDEETGYEAAEARLNEVRPSLTSCDTLDKDLKDYSDIENESMGEIKVSEMSDQIVNALEGVEAGQTSTPIEGPGFAISFFVCEKSVTGANVPTRDQIEDRLIDQQLAQASKRHLRDLRRGATISIR